MRKRKLDGTQKGELACKMKNGALKFQRFENATKDLKN